MHEAKRGKGDLRAVLSTGWISAYELARLAPGALVCGSKEAGEPATLELGGSFLASCEIVVFGDRKEGDRGTWGARVLTFDRLDSPTADPERGDEIAEMLPFKISLPAAAYSLGDLAGVGVGTLVSLDRAFPESQWEEKDVELTVCDLVVARGRCAVAGERLGMLVDEVMAGAPEPAAVRLSGSVFTAEQMSGKKVKRYDFKRPDRFDRPGIRAVHAIHERVPLAELSPALKGYCLALIDQMTWGEWCAEFGKGKSVASFDGRRYRREYERGSEPSRDAAPIVAPSDPARPLSPETLERMRAIVAGATDYDGASPVIAAAVGNVDLPDPALFSRALRSGWRTIADIGFAEPIVHEAPPERAWTGEGDPRGMDPSEMVLLAAWESPSGDGAIHVVYAARTIKPLSRALSSFGKLASS
jgi:flagellar motor switch/type III secretory pathway protein FliN